jgi:FlaA1/EpsC-like NDP-sugar epimerase
MRVLSAEEATRNRTVGFYLQLRSIGLMRARLSLATRSSVMPIAHLAVAVSSYCAAVALASEGRGSLWVAQVLRDTILFVILLRLAGVFWMQLHRRSLRYANSLDLIAIVKAVVGGTVVLSAAALVLPARPSLPPVIFVLDAAFLILGWSVLHFGGRLLRARSAAARKAGKPVVIVGAGDAAASVLKELSADSGSLCRAVAIVDDDRRKWNRSICGVRVEGGTGDLCRIAADKKAVEILVCVPSASRAQMSEILKACRQASLPVRTLPSISELVGGKVSRQDFRRPRVEEILQRDGIELDLRETRRVVAGKTVLVTGAGGSIGSELCRQIAAADPRRLLLLDHSENSLFYAHLEARERLGPDRAEPLLMDLLQADALRGLMLRERPEVVFHAAAHKHVGLLELYAHEAIRNNVLATRNLAQAALECGALRFVNISTDKAVSPRNYMGASKKLTELCIQELARQTGARFSNVRFGNVAGSTGSVLRLFWDQIQRGGPVRVTDPHATRYFMTIPEAVHLILRAAALSAGGETFVFDMGQPVNIYELARTMILFAGLKPDEDVRIEFTGLKSGEKSTEELWEEWEHASPTECPRILAIRGASPASEGILEKVRRMEEFLSQANHDVLLEFVQEIVPGFRPASPLPRSRSVVPSARQPEQPLEAA